MASKSMRYFWRFVVACAAVDIAAGIVYSFFPQWRSLITSEDRFVEWAGAATFMFAFVLGMIVLRGRKVAKLGRSERMPVYLASGLGLFCFLEEISYGGRFLHVEPPYVAGIGFDAVHDIFYIAYSLSKPYFSRWVFLVVGLAIAVAVIVHRKRLKRFASRVLASEPYLLIAAAVSCLVLSQVGDLRIVVWEHERFFEELFELNAGMALVSCILTVARRPAQSEPPDG